MFYFQSNNLVNFYQVLLLWTSSNERLLKLTNDCQHFCRYLHVLADTSVSYETFCYYEINILFLIIAGICVQLINCTQMLDVAAVSATFVYGCTKSQNKMMYSISKHPNLPCPWGMEFRVQLLRRSCAVYNYSISIQMSPFVAIVIIFIIMTSN